MCMVTFKLHIYLLNNLLFSSCTILIFYGIYQGHSLEKGLVLFPDVLINEPKLVQPFHKPIFSSNIHPNKEDGQHRWVPGKVVHHLYIPPHLSYILLSSSRKKIENRKLNYFYYNNHINNVLGNYGQGLNKGGHGAGHGFQINFNN